MKIKILYSHYNTQDNDGKYRPSWFNYEKCFKNFTNSINEPKGVLVDLHVIYDITRGELKDNWLNNYRLCDLEIHRIKGGSMFGAAKEMYRIAKELSEDMEDGDLFYFMENDYLHVDGWVGKVTELFKTFSNLNYVSLYDHNDKYTWMHLYEELTSKIFVTDTHHWRTVPNTCGTYLCTKKLFLEDYDIHSGMEGDANRWAWLAENRGRFLLSPLPGLNTHCMETLLSPTIDWKKINNKI